MRLTLAEDGERQECGRPVPSDYAGTQGDPGHCSTCHSPSPSPSRPPSQSAPFRLPPVSQSCDSCQRSPDRPPRPALRTRNAPPPSTARPWLEAFQLRHGDVPARLGTRLIQRRVRTSPRPRFPNWAPGVPAWEAGPFPALGLSMNPGSPPIRSRSAWQSQKGNLLRSTDGSIVQSRLRTSFRRYTLYRYC
ncbi:hypothetical protein BC628DRAFT_943481 [Trametes gibbosa]|nr:hypothetical protein BC628DRAFT_943481 [Trametes gibbosa]